MSAAMTHISISFIDLKDFTENIKIAFFFSICSHFQRETKKGTTLRPKKKHHSYLWRFP